MNEKLKKTFISVMLEIQLMYNYNFKTFNNMNKMDLSIFKNKYPWSIDVKTKEVARKIKGETVHITTGELFNNPAIITHKRYDSKQFTKVYQDLIKAKYGFKPSTERIVDYIIANLPKNEPVIAVDLDAITAYFLGFKSNIKLMSNNKIMSAHAYGRALKELQENKIIAPTGQGNIYYINVNLIHNGSRVIVADIIERVEKTEQDKLEDAGQQRLGI